MRRTVGYCREHLALIAYLVLVAALLAGTYRVETLARSTHEALCEFKADVAAREEAARDFIGQIERGERPPIPGISTNDLERSRVNHERTLEALADLDCG